MHSRTHYFVNQNIKYKIDLQEFQTTTPNGNEDVPCQHKQAASNELDDYLKKYCGNQERREGCKPKGENEINHPVIGSSRDIQGEWEF